MTAPDAKPAAAWSIPDFWDRLHIAGASLLVLDYDGTIAPFRTERMKALPLPGMACLLEKIREKTRGSLAIMSGRPVSEILSLLGDLCIMTVGGHGSEFRFPDGTMFTIEPTALQRNGLDEAQEAVAGVAGDQGLERKTMSVALHTRGLEKDAAYRIEGLVREKWTAIGGGRDLDLLKFNGGLELRCRGINKGNALLRLLSNVRRQVFTVYLGDDETDEDAFRVMDGRGVGIRVGQSCNSTLARGTLGDIREVKEFLQEWLEHAPGARPGEVIWKREDWR